MSTYLLSLVSAGYRGALPAQRSKPPSDTAGMLGPELFGLPLRASAGTIIGFNALAVLPVAYLWVPFAPQQQVQAR